MNMCVYKHTHKHIDLLIVFLRNRNKYKQKYSLAVNKATIERDVLHVSLSMKTYK